jgi:N-acetylglucosamine malate deacetylase 1
VPSSPDIIPLLIQRMPNASSSNILRRHVLGLLAATPLLGGTPPIGNVLVTGGHPGDPEYGCGGTIAKLAQLGYRVTILYLNRGEKGCGPARSDCGEIRTKEAEAACRILNATPLFGKEVDGESVVDNAAYASFNDLIGQQQPDLIITHWPLDNHRDHRAMSMLSYDAWRSRRATCSLYYYEVTDGEDTMMFAPTDYVDITVQEPLKRKACFAHASQSPGRFYSIQSGITRFRGAQAGYGEAEAFIRAASSRAHPMLTNSAKR